MTQEPEVLPPEDRSSETRRSDLRRFAQILDSAVTIPGTNVSIGLESILGLFPGFGDALGGLLSAYIVLQAAREGVSSWVLMKMIVNIVIDSVLGSVPVLGDIFDLVWKANIRNIDLLECSPRVVPPGPQNQARLFWVVLALLLMIMAIMIGGLALVVRLIR